MSVRPTSFDGLPGPLSRFFALGDDPDASDEDRLKRRFMLGTGAVMAFGGLVWGTLSLAFGFPAQAAIPYGYTVITAVNFTLFARSRAFAPARVVQITISLALPFLFQWAMGGFVASGAVMVWAVLALISSFTYNETRTSYWVLSLFLGLTIASGVVDSQVREQGIDVSSSVSTLFFVLNFGVASAALFFMTLYFVRQTEEARALRRADQMKSEFLSTVSHELRTPLTSILGFTEMINKKLERTVFPAVSEPSAKIDKTIEQIRMNLRIISEEGERLTALINDVLDITKMESGEIDWQADPIDVAAMIDRATEVCAALFVAKDDVELQVRADPDLPALVGDRDRLLQVVINLVSNAAKFTDEGHVRVTARLAVLDGAPAIEVVVADTGSGIPSADLERVFERFKQVGDTLTDKPKGTGLGLPISRHIVEHHGGRLWAESRIGIGSRFHVLLPVDRGDVAAADPGAHGGLHESEPSGRPGKRILIVDDDPAILELLGQELESEAHHVARCGTAEEALEQVQVAWPDLLVVDVMLPGRSGLDLVDELRRLDGGTDIPIIVISAADNAASSHAAGVDRYYSKPLDLAALHRDVDEVLGEAGGGDLDGTGGTVLVVDDDASVRTLLRQELEEAGYDVDEAADGRAGLERARASRPDLVLLDVVMPDLSGFDVAAALRADPETSAIPIIILSVVGDTRGHRVGIDRFFKKPVDLDMLQREVASLIADGPGRAAAVGGAVPVFSLTRPDQQETVP